MASKKRKGSVGRKVLAGSAVLAAAAGVATLASNKKLRNKVQSQAKKVMKDVRSNPTVKKAGREAEGFVAKLGRFVADLLK